MSTSASGTDLTAPGAPPAAPPADAERTAQRERLRLLVGSKTFIAGVIIVGIFVIFAIFGETLAPDDPFATDPLDDLAAPSGEHLFGTDRVGRDVLSRVIVGARDILIVALLALPTVIIGILAIVALGTSKLTVIAVIGIVFAPIIARTVRAAVLQEREMEYVAAAQLRNERTSYILFAEILPNVMGPVMVEFTVRLGYAIFTVATLSFLGFGIQPPAPDWGLQVFEHYGLISGGYWWPVLFPALAIAILVVGVNLLADGIAGAFER